MLTNSYAEESKTVWIHNSCKEIKSLLDEKEEEDAELYEDKGAGDRHIKLPSKTSKEVGTNTPQSQASILSGKKVNLPGITN